MSIESHNEEVKEATQRIANGLRWVVDNLEAGSLNQCVTRFDFDEAGVCHVTMDMRLAPMIRAEDPAEYSSRTPDQPQGQDGGNAATLPKGWQDVLDERRRQVHIGFTKDDTYLENELPCAAITYIMNRTDCGSAAFSWWPWHPNAYKPTNRRRDMVKAAALLLAEIDRLDRASGNVANEGDA